MSPVVQRVALAVCAALLAHTPALAQKPDEKKPSGKLESNPEAARVAEIKLLAQLAEYLHRDTFPPDAKPDEKDDPASSGQLKTFIEGRRVMVGHIMARLREIKATGELEGLYDDYNKVLTESTRYADAVRKHELEYFEGKKRLRERLKANIEITRLFGAADLLRENARVYAYSVGWWRWYDPWSRRRSILGGLMITTANTVAANLEFRARVIRLIERHKDAMARYESVALPKLYAAMRSEEEDFRRRLQTVRPPMVTKGADRMNKLTTEFKWKPFEVTFRPFDDGFATASNPFAPLSTLNRAKVIDGTEQARECAAMADKMLDLLETVPTPKDGTKLFNRVRADVAFMAGMHANRAAEYQLGDAGFLSLKRAPLPAGKTAQRAFDMYKAQYVGNETMYPKWMVSSQVALADAYAGFPQKAYETANRILPKDEQGVSDPQYFYDMARLLCLNERDNRNIPNAYSHLTAAFMLGYKNTEKARVSADFADLRKTQKDFESTINVFKE